MNKKQYKQHYRLARIISDLFSVKTVKEYRKQVTISTVDFMTIQTHLINSKKEFNTVFGSRSFGFNPEHTIEDNSRINREHFKKLLKETYK